MFFVCLFLCVCGGGTLSSNSPLHSLRFVYWTVTSTVTTLYQINLNDTTVTSRTPISRGMTKRRRRRQISSNLTPALALDPNSGNLLLCDRSTGDIIQCQPDMLNCLVLVSQSVLVAANPGQDHVGECLYVCLP